MKVKEFADGLGLMTCSEFDVSLLVPEERIRAFCIENKCGSYGKNHTCPPLVGTLEQIKTRLEKYSEGILLQYSKDMEVDKKNAKKINGSKNDFHKKVLEIEKYLHENGITDTWGMIGGNCGLCRTCKAVKNKPCKHPEESRVSLEAIGVDVVSLLEKLGLDSGFHTDRITWTGVVLYNRE
ncbi:MAG: DUF2284 domain-containing protein [Dehalococcoidales bacterium]|nr:DUF2284 domain-containing protein [Dehalococcoidales bacterium]